MRQRATIFTMKQTDARITKLMSRLTVLERERVEILAEIKAQRSMQSEGTSAIKVSGNAGPTKRRVGYQGLSLRLSVGPEIGWTDSIYEDQ